MMRQANYSGAMIAFDRALRMNFDNDVREAAFYNYAVAKTEGGKIPFGNSVATFEEFLRAFPDSRHASAVREYLVAGYMTDNNYAAALASINQIKNPSKKILGAKQQVLYALGSREVMAGQNADAISHLKEAVSLRQHDAKTTRESELWLGEAYYANGDYADALDHITQPSRLTHSRKWPASTGPWLCRNLYPTRSATSCCSPTVCVYPIPCASRP